jgi:hypothetical protein
MMGPRKTIKHYEVTAHFDGREAEASTRIIKAFSTYHEDGIIAFRNEHNQAVELIAISALVHATAVYEEGSDDC